MTQAAPDHRDDDRLFEIAVRDPGSVAGREAASRLLGRHQRQVYLWCRRYVREHERALDLAQEVLLSAYRAMPGFEGRARFSSWLFAIARNKCLNAVAAKRLLVDDDADPDAQPHGSPGPEAELELQQDEERVRRLLIEHLDEVEREALWLSCFERMPVDEITRVLRLDNATGGRGLLQRARRKLRAGLDRGRLKEGA
ncbi:MAG TPA: sigma-70 family RNA polymerase sigma factor [Dongiaceae bacterium]|nr:sigma-70 family RNA polymerase sigma factor [Dongiaceae bacterium]